jgi:hypothetical protein
MGRNVCFWHKADIEVMPSDVRFWGGKADIANSPPHVR